MPATSLKLTAVALAVAAFVVPVAQGGNAATLSPAQTSRLGAQTEAKGFIALNHYLVSRDGHGLTAADIARLGGLTEAQGYRAISTHLVQEATGSHVSTSTAGFAWRDALIGAAFTAGLFLIGGAAALGLRRRHAVPQLRN